MLQLNENKQFAFFQRLAFPLRIFLLILVFSIFVIAALAQYFTASFEDYLTLHVRDMAMNQAKIIASNDSIISAVKTRDYKRLATIANKLQRDTDFDYVVIGDRHSIRLYHPNPEKIGYPMQFTKQGALEKGESYFITGKGSMGMAMRAKTPIFDDDGKVIGVVSIGYLVSKIDSWRAEFLLPMAGVFVVLLGILMLLSWFLAAHIRRQMMGMEPKQIARVVRQQEALFSSVYEGLIAVDPHGYITAINRNARKMLGLSSPGRQWLGKPIAEVVRPADFFTEQIDEKRQEPIGKFGDILFAEKMPGLDFSYTTDAKEAYQDMDFIFMQMRAGGLEMRAKDEHIPLSMGMIGQETCGAGGMSYGLRSCVEMIKAIHEIRKYSPNAWILNYTNPAAIVAEALRREFPDDQKILNICDQPENVVRSCSRLLGCEWEDLDPVYFGLNHFGWFTHMYNKTTGEDLLPKIKELIKKNGFLPQDAEQRDQSWLDTYGMVQTIMNDFPDYLPNTYDQYYLYPEYKASHLNPDFTRADEVMAGREKRVFKECNEIISEGKLGKKLENISDAHAEMMIKVAEAIAFNKNNRHILIVENNGAIANMQDDAMVEVVCELGINGPRPMRVGNIPQFYLGLLVNQVSCEKLIVDAYYEKSYNKALQAFTLNRLVNDAKKARPLLDALIEANKGMWPELR